MDEISTIIKHDNNQVINNNIFPNDNEHNTSFLDQLLCKTTKIIYISFTLESTFNISRIKYRSRYNSTNGILETLYQKIAFLKMDKYNSQKKESIGFFLGINPKLTLRMALKKKSTKSVYGWT